MTFQNNSAHSHSNKENIMEIYVVIFSDFNSHDIDMVTDDRIQAMRRAEILLKDMNEEIDAWVNVQVWKDGKFIESKIIDKYYDV